VENFNTAVEKTLPFVETVGNLWGKTEIKIRIAN
jgi:hypothetical protein